jgi:nucleotide-binding universal stress UspA family protein
MKIEKILVAYDGSEESKQGLEWAIMFVQKFSALVEVVAVVKAPEFSTSIDEVEEYLADGEKLVMPLLKSAEKYLCDAGVDTAKSVILRGHPAESIIHHAESNDFDLIVIGNRGKGGFKNMLLGSIVNKVATYSKVPVLIMK